MVVIEILNKSMNGVWLQQHSLMFKAHIDSTYTFMSPNLTFKKKMISS
jgi:hypothetical protein